MVMCDTMKTAAIAPVNTRLDIASPRRTHARFQAIVGRRPENAPEASDGTLTRL
jgi:hypothetical protein